jgi:glycosyltransferase involved in cell wall biosynthesis
VNIAGIFLGNQIRTGGHVRYLDLMESLAARGNRVVVLLNSALGYEPRSFEGIAHRVEYRRKGFPPASWIFRAEAARRSGEVLSSLGRADAVLVFGETHLAAGARLSARLKAPLLYGQRSNIVRQALAYLEEEDRGRLDRLRIGLALRKSRLDERRIGRLADLAVFQSAYDRDDFVSRVRMPVDRTAIIRSDISGPRFKAEYSGTNRSDSLRRVLFMGTLWSLKGIDYLIEAILLLSRRGFGHLRFDICGPGDRRAELEARLKAGGAGQMAAFHGRVADPFIPAAQADLVVVPSLNDSYPNSILEAIHVGTPVIGSRVGGIPDMLGYDELLFPPMDAEAIADRIERCAVDAEFYARLRTLCASRAEYFRFDWAGEWERVMAERLGRA